ncbi:MAG: ABC transporter permease, partial [Oscillospiraceae bacterium]|nr:ABC transporter permease [Oscillospiraceae bacterium]
MTNFVNSLGIILFATLAYSTPLLYAALGSCFSEVSGVVNIGIEGMMTAGAFAGTVIAYFTGNPWIGFLCGGLAGALFGALHAIATVNLGADQTIAGTAINMLGPGIAIMLAKVMFNSTDTIPLTQAQKIPKLFSGAFNTSTVFGRFMDNVFANYASTYLVFIAAILVWFVFYKTRFGLRLRGCGEHPQACETLGIDVIKMRFLCVCISGFLAGLGGACVTMTISTQFRPISIVGQGFIAIAAVIFGKFRPHGALIGCLLFGFCSGLKVVLGGSSGIDMQLISMIPYVVTVIVLVLFVGKSHVPAANGKP